MSGKHFDLGDEVKDDITGFSGIIIARTDWINGCQRYTVQPKTLTKEGGIKETQTIDVEQLTLVHAAKKPTHKPSGGPMPAPVRR